MGLVVPLCAAQGEVSAENEKLLGQFAAVFEDVVAALTDVQTKAEADVVASRVAVDFILLQRLNREVLHIDTKVVRPAFAREFAERCTRAQSQVKEAAGRLAGVRCFGSKALEAALTLATLVSGQLSDEAAILAGRELVVNHLEVSSRLLREVKDFESAEKVAPMLKVALECGRVLNEFRLSYESRGQSLMKEPDFEERVRRFREDLARSMEQLQIEGFYDSVMLREVLQAESPLVE